MGSTPIFSGPYSPCDKYIFGSHAQMLATRLDHVEKEKLNAECELQDLLQHNSVLEDNVAALKKELEEARKEIKDRK